MSPTEAEYDDQESLLGPEHPCPECGAYYTLSITAPPMPVHLAEYGTDEEIAAWDDDNDRNISQCTSCGWRSDDD
jgi:hypothetical protein